MTNKPLPKRPAGSVFKWSHAQGVTWIRKSVRAGAVRFSSHAFQREVERNVTHEQALQCILDGVPAEWEEGRSRSGKPDRRISFKQKLRTKIIRVVTVVDDDENLVIIATVIDPKY